MHDHFIPTTTEEATEEMIAEDARQYIDTLWMALNDRGARHHGLSRACRAALAFLEPWGQPHGKLEWRAKTGFVVVIPDMSLWRANKDRFSWDQCLAQFETGIRADGGCVIDRSDSTMHQHARYVKPARLCDAERALGLDTDIGRARHTHAMTAFPRIIEMLSALFSPGELGDVYRPFSPKSREMS